jgi:hypothetical protein
MRCEGVDGRPANKTTLRHSPLTLGSPAYADRHVPHALCVQAQPGKPSAGHLNGEIDAALKSLPAVLTGTLNACIIYLL